MIGSLFYTIAITSYKKNMEGQRVYRIKISRILIHPEVYLPAKLIQDWNYFLPMAFFKSSLYQQFAK
jgi:fructose-specific component phosphotransferase system IIB-like protein